MIVLIVAAVLVFTRLIWSLILPWRLFSVSTANLLATLLFVAFGLQYLVVTDPFVAAVMVCTFYFFLLMGEFIGRAVHVDRPRFAAMGRWFSTSQLIFYGFFIVFWAFCFLPIVNGLASGQSLSSMIASTWASNGVGERSARLVDSIYGRNVTGIAALLLGIQRQLVGFWYLSIGVLFWRKRKTVYVGLMVFAFGTFATSGGARSGIIAAIAVIGTLWLLSRTKGKAISLNWKQLAFIALLGVGSLFVLDFLMAGRTGTTVSGGLIERFDRLMQRDIAYGGLGIDFGTELPPPTYERGADYLLRLVSGPVPRVLWPGKSTVDANLEMTEAYVGRPIEQIGSIYLFTPIGEALFYFGLFGLFLVPFLYGLTTTWLERIYSTSPAYWGLLAQVYVWSLLGMRQSFWNLWGALVVANFLLLVFLFLVKSFFSRRKERTARSVPSESRARASAQLSEVSIPGQRQI